MHVLTGASCQAASDDSNNHLTLSPVLFAIQDHAHGLMSLQDLQDASVHQHAMMAAIQDRLDRIEQQLQAMDSRKLQRTSSAWAILGR